MKILQKIKKRNFSLNFVCNPTFKNEFLTQNHFSSSITTKKKLFLGFFIQATFYSKNFDYFSNPEKINSQIFQQKSQNQIID